MSDAVTVAYVHPNEVAHSWHMSMLSMVGYDLTSHGRVVRGGWLAIRCGTDGLAAARNTAVSKFLLEKDADWLFWVDTDMGFTPDTIDRLLEVAHPTERPIVGALCFAQKEMTADGYGGYRTAPRATILDWAGDQFAGRSRYPINTVTRCAGTGSAAILIHRSVLERIAEEFGPTWYDRQRSPSGSFYGEDISFCIRAGALDIPIHVHTGVKTTHLKNLWLSEADYWRHAEAPPATQPTAVIVPVMQRPQNAAPFMASLRASTGLATVYAVAHPDDKDTIRAWRTAGAEVLIGDVTTFAEKVNVGYESTDEPWIFLAGDDVTFHAGWLDHAQAIAGDRHHVIGTNDAANPRVTSGDHATHMLIRRSYIDDQGASWDGPKVVAHEGYGHWCVDDEIVRAAKQRSVWAMALGAIVEHRNPEFGTAEDDPVYELGRSHADADLALFERRCAEHAPAGT